MAATIQQQKDFAVNFTENLATRNYNSAYAMTSASYQHRSSLEELQDKFEQIIPPDWNLGEIVAIERLESWPDKQESDLSWVYVSIGGDLYSEAVAVVVGSEEGQLKINRIQFGRP